MNNSSMNKLAFGKIGSASKTILFKEREFKKELAPTNAKIEKLKIKGENFVRMQYKL
ncbi:hypothetical protein AB3M94_19705 [Peribacillus frigoritolerans]